MMTSFTKASASVRKTSSHEPNVFLGSGAQSTGWGRGSQAEAHVAILSGVPRGRGHVEPTPPHLRPQLPTGHIFVSQSSGDLR